MKILIDIDEIVIEPIQNILNSGSDIPLGINAHMIKAIANGTPIPDNATNSDVMLTMFPDETDLHTFARHNKVAWWYAPY